MEELWRQLEVMCVRWYLCACKVGGSKCASVMLDEEEEYKNKTQELLFRDLPVAEQTRKGARLGCFGLRCGLTCYFTHLS